MTASWCHPGTTTSFSAVVLSLGLVAAVACRDPQAPTERTLALISVRLEPVVTRSGGAFTLALRVTGARSPRIHAHPQPAGLGLVRDGAILDSLILHDDATNGDLTAGDGWFALDGLVLPPMSQGVTATTLSGFSALHEPGVPHGDSVPRVLVSFRTADPALVGSPAVTDPAADARTTSRVVALLDPDARDLGEPGLQRIVRRYYQLFPDDRDFLAVLVPPTVGEPWSARAYQIRNEVAGLGLPVAEWRDFGSAARLSLVVHARNAVYTVRDGAGSFCLLNHELTHRWAAYPTTSPSARARGGTCARTNALFPANLLLRRRPPRLVAVCLRQQPRYPPAEARRLRQVTLPMVPCVLDADGPVSSSFGGRFTLTRSGICPAGGSS